MVNNGQDFDANMSTVFSEHMELRKPNNNLKVYLLPHIAMTTPMLQMLDFHMVH